MHSPVSVVQGVVQILHHVERHLQRNQLEAQLSADEASYRATYDVRRPVSRCSVSLHTSLMVQGYGSPTAWRPAVLKATQTSWVWGEVRLFNCRLQNVVLRCLGDCCFSLPVTSLMGL